MFGMFESTNQLPGGNTANTDGELQSAASQRDTVGTAKAIRGFIPASKSEVEADRNALKQRREQSTCFRQLLSINLAWQETDHKDTKALTAWRATTTRNLMRKSLVVARGAAKQEVLGAQFQSKVKQLQETTKDKIDNLKTRKEQAKNRVHQPA